MQADIVWYKPVLLEKKRIRPKFHFFPKGIRSSVFSTLRINSRDATRHLHFVGAVVDDGAFPRAAYWSRTIFVMHFFPLHFHYGIVVAKFSKTFSLSVYDVGVLALQYTEYTYLNIKTYSDTNSDDQ
ncbi:Fasciclin-like arabinogalactan protein [Dirofilaria immitis]